ncbi:ESPR-type extended signal peptide-containing protein [Haemophilus sp. SZY H68]|uniref:ESPR-type extended signal peptide-containing protein n=2 Tax=unclassified Haemophilus TaxID=2609962 RepID=UPI001C0549D1|nr:ESPR-type extended signal peptide-containing protein [Haemophilus sp. SZY H68]
MNHIYKVIWNTITQTWVAVSELSRAKGKTKSSKTLSAVVLAATSGILISGQAQSANEVGSAKDNSSVVFGIQSHASHDAVAVGGESNARAYEDVAIGYKATSGAELKIENGKEVTHSSNQSSVAVGTHAQATHVATTAIGAHAQAIHNFATAVGAGAIANHENASAFGEGAKAQGTYSTALGKGALATEDYAVALGKEASSTNTYSTSIGTKANATGQSSLAIGGAAIDSLPIKTNKEGKQYSDLEDGVGAKATGQDSAAIGASANATAKAALAVGKMANASANSTIAVGDQAQASGEKATSIGAGAIAKNEGTIAIGNGAKVGATNGNVAANNGIAIGTESESKNEQAIAVGKKAIAAGNNSIALGNATTTTGGEGVAIGNTASASHHSVAFGSQAKATAEGGYSSAFGNESEANKADSSALGNTAKALAKNATSVGAHSKVTETAENGSALGRSANVSATNGTALGSSSKVEAENGTAVGTSATVSTAGGVALGQGSKSTRAALDGKNITITSQGNIVSSNHITDKDNSPVSDVYAPVKLINDSSILERVKNTIKGTAGAVSLGNDSTTRQLTNLAPGSADSDAVNVAQLKAVVGGIVKYNVTSPDKSITIDSKDETTDGVRKTTFNVTMNTTAVKDAAAWKIKANKETDNQATSVKGGDIVTFKTKDGGNSGDTIKITRNGKELTFEANFATIRTPGTGMVNVDDTVKDNWLAKAKNVAEAINASGWILQANGNKVGLINPGNKVNIATDANSGITITPTNENADGVSTIKLKANVTGLTAGNNVTISSKDGNYTINAIDTNTQASVSPKSGSPITVTKTTTTPNSPDYAVGLNIDDKTLEIKGGKLAARTQAQAIESVEKKDVEDNIAEVDVKSGSTKGAANAVYTVAVTKSAVKDAAAWNIKEGSETTSTAVKGGDTLTLSDTNTIDVVHNGKDFTFNAKTATIQTEQKQAITKIDVSNAGITTKTTGGNNTPTGRFVVPTGNDADKHALATAYDVADKVNQTGWNLYSNGLSPTLINPGDYVNFKSGKATKANIVTEASEGATISYDVNVDNTTIKIDSDGNKLAANTGDVDSVTSTEGNSKKGQVVIHKNPLEPSKTDSGKLATVDTVVKAVNNAKWFTIAKDSDDKVTGETKTNESEGTAMAAGETLGLNAGKNLRLKREANTNNFTFALDSNLKDLDSVHTKEIKLGESNNPISIKNDGDRITYTTKGGDNSDVTHKVANLEDEKHIKPTTDGNEYTVDASGNITMTYADGNNKDVTNTKAVIKGVAKNDLSNITNDGKKAITTLGSVVKAGDNVLVDEDTDAVTGKKTYTVNAVTPVVYTDKKGNRVYKFKKDGVEKFYTKPNGEGEEVTNKDEIIASFYDANNSTTAGAMIVNNIGSAIKNATVPAGKDANNFLNKLEVAASDTGTQNAAVNVSDLHNTADALRSNEIHIAPTTDKTEGKEATHYKYNATTKQVEMTYEDGKGNKVANKKAVIDLSSLADSVHNYGFKANATGHLETGSTAAETEVENGKTVNFDAGKNLTVTQTVDGTSKNHTYSFALSNNIDLTNAGSITMGNTKVDNGGITINATTPVAGETRKPDVTLTNTGLSNGDNHITNVKGNLPDTYNTTEGDKTITKKQDAPTSITKTNAATVGDVLNAGWNLQGNGSDIDFVKPYDTVNFANGTGTTATVTNMDGKTTTVKYDVAVGKGLEVDGDNKVTVKTDGDTITVGEDGKLKASLSTEKVKAATGDDNIATVTPKEGEANTEFGKKGATYEVAVTKSAVKQVAKTAVKVAAGDNVIVSSADNQAGDETTYTVEAVTPVVYTDKQGNRVYKVKDGNGYKFTKNADGTGAVVNKSDVIASFYDGNSSATAGTMIVNNIGSAIKNVTVPADKDANNFLNKLEVATSSTGTPNAAVNVSDLHNTAEALRSNEIHIAPTKDAEGQNSATHYTYNAATKQVEMTYEDGKGNKVANKKAVIDLSSLADSVHNYGFKANATGNLEASSTAAETEVENGKTVNFDAGKNLTVKQTVDATSKNHTYSFALKDDVVIGAKGENGKDGIDGSIGVNGKDGSAVAINGKDGSIGLNGKDGKNGLTIKGQDGKVGVDGKDGETRLVYVEKADPTKPGSTDKTHKLATLDDGMKYGGDIGEVANVKLNKQVDIKGGVTDKTKLSDNNIGVVSTPNATTGGTELTVKLAKELKGLTSAEFNDGKDKTKTEITHNGIAITPVNPENGKTSVTLTDKGLNNGGNTITNVAEGKNGTDAVNVNQLNKVEAKINEGGLTFAGNSGTPHKANLNTTVNIKGGKDNTDATQFDDGKNVMTTVNKNTVTVAIKKTPEVEGINIIDKDGKVKVKLTQTNEGLKVSDGNDKETRITNVAEGKNGTDAVNVKQLNAAKTEVTAGDNIDVVSRTGANGQTIYKVSAKGINDTSAAVKAGSNHVEVTKAANTHKDGSTTVTDYTVDLSKETKEDIKKGVDAHTEVTTKGLTFNADHGTTGVKKLGSKVAVNGDGKNITTTADENGVKVSMKDDIKVNSVTAKEVKVGDVNINENGINAGGKRITNVAPGKDGTDAVNVNQLKYVAGNISNQINNVDKGLRAGIAGALASGGLYHVTTAGKSMVSVGAGTYRGQNALAVGYSRLSDNGKVGVKFTVNSNSQGHSGASASVGYQW